MTDKIMLRNPGYLDKKETVVQKFLTHSVQMNKFRTSTDKVAADEDALNLAITAREGARNNQSSVKGRSNFNNLESKIRLQVIAENNKKESEDALDLVRIETDSSQLECKNSISSFQVVHKETLETEKMRNGTKLMLVHSEYIDGLDLYRADCTNEYLSVLCSSDEKEAYLKTINAFVAVDKSQPVWQLRQVVEKPLDDTRVKLTGVMLEANLANCWLYDVQDIFRCTPLCSFEKPDQILLVDTVLPNLYLTARRVLPLITGDANPEANMILEADYTLKFVRAIRKGEEVVIQCSYQNDGVNKMCLLLSLWQDIQIAEATIALVCLNKMARVMTKTQIENVNNIFAKRYPFEKLYEAVQAQVAAVRSVLNLPSEYSLLWVMLLVVEGNWELFLPELSQVGFTVDYGAWDTRDLPCALSHFYEASFREKFNYGRNAVGQLPVCHDSEMHLAVQLAGRRRTSFGVMKTPNGHPADVVDGRKAFLEDIVTANENSAEIVGEPKSNNCQMVKDIYGKRCDRTASSLCQDCLNFGLHVHVCPGHSIHEAHGASLGHMQVLKKQTWNGVVSLVHDERDRYGLLEKISKLKVSDKEKDEEVRLKYFEPLEDLLANIKTSKKSKVSIF